MTALDAPSAAPTFRARAGSLAMRALRVELRIYASIARAIARRPAVAPGAAGFGYHAPILTILIVFIVLSAVEIPILDLIFRDIVPVRIALLVLGIWGLTWMIGLLCAMLMRPHTVGPDGIRVREGLEIDVPLSWDDIASVELARRVDEEKAPRIADDGGVPTLAVRIANETSILIVLERPTAVTLPGLAPKGGRHVVERVRLWADDPKALMREVARHI
ncbi:hypothetical protein ACOKGD_09980 [Microbacterium phosphatis]|uniref:hypothetical protein n=1 Tax=Microbacterium phosphatis TaxID=3140248 RepID=UPI003140B9E4